MNDRVWTVELAWEGYEDLIATALWEEFHDIDVADCTDREMLNLMKRTGLIDIIAAKVTREEMPQTLASIREKWLKIENKANDKDRAATGKNTHEKSFEADCPTCSRTNVVTITLRKDSFNELEDFHCAYCGLRIDQIHAAKAPKSRLREVGGHDADEDFK
ncbi:MAG: hypothetical protein FWH05_05920 [Oscillospiraceae bacterium]|nr:hypothetical protein [Oscillospiraceae bacterium]